MDKCFLNRKKFHIDPSCHFREKRTSNFEKNDVTKLKVFRNHLIKMVSESLKLILT